MTSNIGQIKNSQILVQPSKRLREYLKDIKTVDGDAPLGIQNIVYKNKPKGQTVLKQPKLEYLTSNEDKKFINSLNLTSESERFSDPIEKTTAETNESCITLHDLHWLYAHIQKENDVAETKTYLHELMEGSRIVLPKNERIPRNEELEKRCQKLKAEQENKEYHNMTKNVDGFKRRLPEDTIAYQLKMMNRHLIAVFQFIVSVMTGFAFGFIGIELFYGALDFGLKLLLGIGCALVIAVAELYFLAKTLNEDLDFENKAKNPQINDKKVK